ncbi:MAG: hypothetical protein ACO1TE_28795 [Prosthecobacter sp.]
MKAKSSALLMLSLIAMVVPLPAAENQRTFEYRGTKYVTKVPNDAPASPTWTPGTQDEPPLSVGAALKLADAGFQKTFGSFGTFKLQNIALTKQGAGWMYYVVYLQDPADIAKNSPAPAGSPSGAKFKIPLSVIYYVTLDGVVRGPEAMQ